MIFKCETTKMKLGKNIKKGFYASTFYYNVIFYQILCHLSFWKFLTFSYNFYLIIITSNPLSTISLTRTKTLINNLLMNFKGALSGLKQCLAVLATKSPFKNDKGNCYFSLKALFLLKIFRFLSWFFSHAEKQFDVTTWETNTCNIHIVQYLQK